MAAGCLVPLVGYGQNTPDYERPPIRYSAATANDEITRLQGEIESGAFALTGVDKEALDAILRRLNVPVSSQVVVFSKTSLQRGRIRPDRPRALYFSDSIYVGWVPGGSLEITAIDPELGPVFYLLDPRATKDAPLKFEREPECLRCHGGTFVRDVPGVFARTVFPDENGEPLLRHGSETVDDETPFERRWGGWYVTGYSGELDHRGNTFGRDADTGLQFVPSPKRPDELSLFFDTSRYLTDTSDVVALLVLEHQMTVQNALTHAAHSARRMLDYQRSLQQAMKDPVTDEPAYDSVKSVFASAVDNVVDRLLFRRAAPLPQGLIGRQDFKRTFTVGAPQSRGGASLKDLELGGRLFVNRCSYLIHSGAFNALPEQLKSRVFERLRAVLSGDDPRGRYTYLEADERRRILEILIDTVPEFTRPQLRNNL